MIPHLSYDLNSVKKSHHQRPHTQTIHIPYCLQVAFTTSDGGSWGYPYILKDLSLQIPLPNQERLATPLRSTSFALFEQWCGFFYVPQEPDTWVLWDGKCSFRPFPRRLESLTVRRCNFKGSTFFSDSKRPWVLVRPVFFSLLGNNLV